MNVTCPRCAKVITITEDKLPKDKEKAMIKCPGCEQVLIFNVPKNIQQPAKDEEKTQIDPAPDKPKTTGNVLLIDTGTKTAYKLKTGKNIIGRQGDICIDSGDRYIGRKHCLIQIIIKADSLDIILIDDGSISDSGQPSTNGTFYNGNRLTKYDKIYLNNGDKLKMGHTEFEIRIN